MEKINREGIEEDASIMSIFFEELSILNSRNHEAYKPLYISLFRLELEQESNRFDKYQSYKVGVDFMTNQHKYKGRFSFMDRFDMICGKEHELGHGRFDPYRISPKPWEIKDVETMGCNWGSILPPKIINGYTTINKKH